MGVQPKELNLLPDQQDKVKKIIKQLHKCYQDEPAAFDFHCSQYISGDHNKVVRQEIMRQITGIVHAKAKCGLHAVADQLKAYFQQTKLF